jgi:putative DNA primase/helicase
MNKPATDFNDLARIHGNEAVRSAIAGAKPPAVEMRQPGEENAADGLQWGEPLRFDEIETPAIPASLLPGIFGQFAHELARATETPEAMAVMTVLGVIATCCAKRFCVSPRDGWREPVNIYTLVALAPGNNKSQVFNACTEPLAEWERQQAEVMEPEIKRAKSERKSQEKIIEAKRGSLAKEKNSAIQKGLIREIADMEADLNEPPYLPELFVNDVTPETFATKVHEQNGRLAIFSDEGGITEIMAGLYSNGTANVDILLKGIDGGHVRVRRKDRSFNLNPFISIVLTVQPVIIQRMSEKRTFAGKGLLERFLWVLPQSRLGYRTHDTEPVAAATRAAYHRAIRTLLEIPALVEHGIEQARVLTLSKDALAEWRAFQAVIETDLRADGRLAPCQGWGAKICGFALRIAGLLHVAEHGQNSMCIGSETMAKALELAALLSEHAIAVYGLMGIDPATADAREVWRWIAAQPSASFIQRDLTYAMRHKLTAERIGKALKLLHCDRNLISEPAREPGKKTLRYYRNPQTIDGGA